MQEQLREVDGASDMGSLTDQLVAGQIVNVLYPLIEQARMLVQKYDVVVTNPPYMGSSGMNARLSDYVKKVYPDSKSDLFAVFIERCAQMDKRGGYQAMITQHAWMFLSSFEKLRNHIVDAQEISSLVHLGLGTFEDLNSKVVQSVAFVLRNNYTRGYTGIYDRLFETSGLYEDNAKKARWLCEGTHRYYAKQDNFSKIPGSPVAYWVSNKFREIYKDAELFESIADIKSGVMSGDDARFIRFWHEVAFPKFDCSCKNVAECVEHKTKWFPVTRGGQYRKWYGNIEEVINLYNGGYEIAFENQKNHRLRDSRYYFREGITWSMITSYKLSVRYVPQGILFGNGGPTCFFSDDAKFYLSVLNSKVAEYIIGVVNPTLNTVISDICGIPIRGYERKNEIDSYTETCISFSKSDWDSFETSWDFKRHPLV